MKPYTESNPPAFPTTMPLDGWGDPNQGMTLRDWFAGQYVSGILSGGAAFDTPKRIADEAYEIADAMMEARK